MSRQRSDKINNIVVPYRPGAIKRFELMVGAPLDCWPSYIKIACRNLSSLSNIALLVHFAIDNGVYNYEVTQEFVKKLMGPLFTEKYNDLLKARYRYFTSPNKPVSVLRKRRAKAVSFDMRKFCLTNLNHEKVDKADYKLFFADPFKKSMYRRGGLVLTDFTDFPAPK